MRLTEADWRPIAMLTPTVGHRYVVWVEHVPHLHRPEYAHATIAEWTDFNKGGWVWHGLAGNITHFLPLDSLPRPALAATPQGDGGRG